MRKHNAIMPPLDRDIRVGNAIESLITHIIPTNPYEDEETANERHETYLEMVQSLLNR